jgi:hypothetical protein
VLYIRSTKKTCVACVEHLEPEKFLDQITKRCNHSVNTCKTCVCKWIDERLTNQGYDKISCPDCSLILQYSDVQQCTTKKQFDRYDRLVLLNTLAKDPDFRWCFSSTCSSGQIHSTQSEGDMMICYACQYRQCTKHNSEWHHGETCAEYDTRRHRARSDEVAATKKVEEISKKCPSCKVPIEKNDGCDHMTCTRCSFQFCWVCLCDYVRSSSDAQYHERACIYYQPWDGIGPS